MYGRRAGAVLALTTVPALVFLATLGWPGTGSEASPASSREAVAPTFYSDVLPILQRHCQTCHQPVGLNMGGMVAPMSFMTYEETRRYAPLIALAVKERRMPPWHADESHKGTFKGERILEAEEREALIAWAEAGAPAGDPSAAPPATPVRLLAEGEWYIGEPDLILEHEFCLSDDIDDLYQTVTVQLTKEMLPEARWIKAVEHRVDKEVHHILGGVGGLAPGHGPAIYDNGYARLIEPGPRTIAFNMHYNKPKGPGTAACPKTRVGIVFHEPGYVVKYITRGDDLGIRDFVIPPGDPNYSATMEYTFEEDAYLLRFNPHMHLRGKAARFEAIHPDGREELLLWIPRYDFNWQNQYEFNEPRLMKAGARIRMTLWWDNSANNVANPDPTIPVRWGLPTTAEMGYGFMQFREVGERHIVVGEGVTADVRDAAASAAAQDGHPQSDGTP
jgi:hypothetical protein